MIKKYSQFFENNNYNKIMNDLEYLGLDISDKNLNFIINKPNFWGRKVGEYTESLESSVRLEINRKSDNNTLNILDLSLIKHEINDITDYMLRMGYCRKIMIYDQYHTNIEILLKDIDKKSDIYKLNLYFYKPSDIYHVITTASISSRYNSYIPIKMNIRSKEEAEEISSVESRSLSYANLVISDLEYYEQYIQYLI